MISLPLLILSALTTVVASTMLGATGFGFMILAAPVLTSYMAPTLAVPVMSFQTLVLGIILLTRVYRDVDLGRVLVLALFGAAFTPVGVVLLVNLDEGVIKVILGAVVGVTALAMLSGFQRAAKNEKAASIPVGIVSGMLKGSTGLGGPPVILFLANQKVQPRQFRANIAAYFFAIDMVSLPSFLVGGLLTRDVLQTTVLLLPASVVGLFIGMWLSRYVSAVVFRRMALIMVLVTACTATVKGILEF